MNMDSAGDDYHAAARDRRDLIHQLRRVYATTSKANLLFPGKRPALPSEIERAMRPARRIVEPERITSR
jgi:hypothetical protein